MGLMDKLNQVTESMNEIADKITGSNQQKVDVAQGDLSSLGNINTNNASCTLQLPAGFLRKQDANIKLLETNMHNFVNNEKFASYLKDLLSSIHDFYIMTVEDGLKAQLNNPNLFYAQYNSNLNFLIMCTIDYNEVGQIIETISTSNIIINNTSKVLIAYFTFDEQTVEKARNCGIELIGIPEFTEINTVATGTLPDMHFGNQRNSFRSCLARTLKTVNNATKGKSEFSRDLDKLTSEVKATVGNITNTINGKINKQVQQNNNSQNITENTNGVNLHKSNNNQQEVTNSQAQNVNEQPVKAIEDTNN